MPKCCRGLSFDGTLSLRWEVTGLKFQSVDLPLRSCWDSGVLSSVPHAHALPLDLIYSILKPCSSRDVPCLSFILPPSFLKLLKELSSYNLRSRGV